ncbi:MAG: urate hydroxylase PuuD [Proteobacteria bacterium]|nr:urate hydroxylase PuuD [Burkholderiales bacterium]
MEAYLLDWISLLLRWLHVIAGIVWIGASFYFVALDNSLEPPNPPKKGVLGENWSIHGGGFYHKQKYVVAPERLPEHLHWFKWEAYWTWLSGFALFVVVYYVHAESMLIDRSVADIAPSTAILASLGLIVAGWLTYDLLCRSPLGDHDGALAAVGFALIALAAWGCAQLFGGRGAYLQVGVMVGTIMVANVAMVIIPGQRRMVEAMRAGRTPDPKYGRWGKQRSIHNNYVTLPVVFIMLCGHYPMTYGHPHAWAVLVAVFAIGGVVRHYFNRRNAGHTIRWLPAAAVAMVLALAVLVMPRVPDGAGGPTSFSDVERVVALRCQSCHAATPTQPGFVQPPGGIMLDTAERIGLLAQKIHQQAVLAKVMPPGNLTGITDDERAIIADWYRQGAPGR